MDNNKRLKVYSSGEHYVTGGVVSMEPSNVRPIKEYDLSKLTEEEFAELKKNPKSKKFNKKLKVL